MTSQYDFSAQDWDRITTAPVLVGFAVARAEDSGFFGSIKENKTLASSFASGGEQSPGRSLISEAAAVDIDEKLNVFKSIGPDELAEAALAACRELDSLLGGTAEPDEVLEYKRWVLAVGSAVAEAAKENGVRVSEPEIALIARIGSALGIQ